MTNYRRNVLVGATVLLGLVILGWMIVQFGDAVAAPFAERTINVVFVADRADGVGTGSPVLFNGVNVGRVSDLKRTDDGLRIRIAARVDAKPPLPGNVEGVIKLTSFVGSGSAIVLQVPEGGPPEGVLVEGQSMTAHFVGFDIVPEGVGDVAEQLRTAVTRFNELELLDNVNDKVTRAGAVLDQAEALLADGEVQGDVRATIANARAATESFKQVGATARQVVDRVSGRVEPIVSDAADAVASAKRTAAGAEAVVGKVDGAVSNVRGEVESLVRQADERLGQAGEAMDKVNGILAKVQNGDGTAGRLVNDPRAYEALVDSLKLLQATLSDAQRYIQQVEQEGLKVGL